jgi:hypothetical protein
MQNPPLGRVGVSFRFVDALRRSVASAALESIEEHVAHGADIGLDAVEPVGVGLAVVGALVLDAVPLEAKLTVEALEKRFVCEGLSGDGGGERQGATDQGGEGRGQAVVAKGLRHATDKVGFVSHCGAFLLEGMSDRGKAGPDRIDVLFRQTGCARDHRGHRVGSVGHLEGRKGDAGIPVIVGVNGLNMPGFEEFAGGLASRMPPDCEALAAWVVAAVEPTIEAA